MSTVPPWPNAISTLLPVYQYWFGYRFGYWACSRATTFGLSTMLEDSPGRSTPVGAVRP